MRVIKMRTREVDRALFERIMQRFYPEPGNLHMERRVFPFWLKVMRGIKVQYLLEAQERNMDINEYIQWLKEEAHIQTGYDCFYRCFKGEEGIDERARELAKRLEEAGKGVTQS